MFRPTILSLVLLLAAGPSAALFCKGWCDPREAARSGCHHENDGNAASVAADRSCQDSVKGTAILAQEDLRRGWTYQSLPLVVAAKFFVPAAATTARPVWNRERQPSDGKRPMATPLRL